MVVFGQPIQGFAQCLLGLRVMRQLRLKARREARADQDHLVQQHVEHYLRKHSGVAITPSYHGNRCQLVTQWSFPRAHEAVSHALQERLEAAVEAICMHHRQVEQSVSRSDARHQWLDIVLHSAVLGGAGVVGVAVFDPVILKPDFLDLCLPPQVAAHQRHHPSTDAAWPARADNDGQFHGSAGLSQAIFAH
ncbi:hypothetical protein ALQ89_200027 [Pseudomonas amygdali pv. tabaci]|uniref:Uncharacterized protein n=1 Tax=Pseudomonas amygdali pv. tabaci TaxID=322 RepID=A0AAX1VZE3_PSEAJ|nr:hypothetical protein ALQ89_200027 [Pseudomonas amygdali pv. tabaci]